MLEFGSGRSTIWYARHAGRVIAIEDSDEWYRHMSRVLGNLGISNVDYRYRPREPRSYCDVSDISAQGIDVAIIDGSFRDEWAVRAIPLIRPGGWLYLGSRLIKPTTL